MTADPQIAARALCDAPSRPAGLNRRSLIKAGAGAAGGLGLFGPSALPLISRRSAAAQGDALTFWQFYAPGGQSRDPEHVVRGDRRGLERAERAAGRARLRAEHRLHGRHQAADGVRRGRGPDLFIISPGDFLRYYNGGVLQDLTPFMEQEAIDDFFPDVLASRIVDDKVYRPPDGGRADGDVLRHGRLGRGRADR